MGMDLAGITPTSATGSHFRNNLWWWRPLWGYCRNVAPDLLRDVNGDTNDGDGLDRDDAIRLAGILREELATGRTLEAVTAFHERQSSFTLKPCDLCTGTGVRTDSIGVQHGMPDKPLGVAHAILVGREHGWCNGCNGEGRRLPHSLAYQFDVGNVEDFAAFAEASGGFQIW